MVGVSVWQTELCLCQGWSARLVSRECVYEKSVCDSCKCICEVLQVLFSGVNNSLRYRKVCMLVACNLRTIPMRAPSFID